MSDCLISRRGSNPELTGDATAEDVAFGKTFYNSDAKNKITIPFI